MAEVTIEATANSALPRDRRGRVREPSGQALFRAKRELWLCRCGGASTRKPFCDGRTRRSASRPRRRPCRNSPRRAGGRHPGLPRGARPGSALLVVVALVVDATRLRTARQPGAEPASPRPAQGLRRRPGRCGRPPQLAGLAAGQAAVVHARLIAVAGGRVRRRPGSARRCGSDREPPARRLARQLDTFLPRVAQAIAQAVRRVLRGETVPAGEKHLSLFGRTARSSSEAPQGRQAGHSAASCGWRRSRAGQRRRLLDRSGPHRRPQKRMPRSRPVQRMPSSQLGSRSWKS